VLGAGFAAYEGISSLTGSGSPGPDGIAFAADDVDSRVRARFEEVRHVFLDATPDRREGRTT